MSYIYHRVPSDMAGDTLFPLNELKVRHPALYAAEAAKYSGREQLMDEQIPILGNCLWNDVLFFIATPPAVLRAAYESIGYKLRTRFLAYRFDVHELDVERMAVLETMGSNRPREFAPFDPASMPRYQAIPDKTFEYWREERRRGVERPFLFLHIPHILYRGPLPVSFATVVEG